MAQKLKIEIKNKHMQKSVRNCSIQSAKLLLFLTCIVMVAFFESCASSARIPTFTFTQYSLESGLSQTQTKLDVEITVKIISIPEIYDYPNLFSFNLDDFSPRWKYNLNLLINYPEDPMGKRWIYPFMSYDDSLQLLLCWVRIKNNTKHILRMKDARIYLIIEGKEPIPPLSTVDELIRVAVYFETVAREQWKHRILGIRLPPAGFVREFINSKRNFYRMFDIGIEMLPGFTYEGILAFLVVANAYSLARISFFDVTTRTDAAGNPLEKTQFDFLLRPQRIQIWYDDNENRWKAGAPPIQ